MQQQQQQQRPMARSSIRSLQQAGAFVLVVSCATDGCCWTGWMMVVFEDDAGWRQDRRRQPVDANKDNAIKSNDEETDVVFEQVCFMIRQAHEAPRMILALASKSR